MGSELDPQYITALIIVLFFGIGLHEYAHCKFADMAGDPTPRYYGRVTLNLFKHFELSGVIFMAMAIYSGFGLGWGKPSPMNPNKMRNPRWDWFIAIIAGPISNICQAAVYALLFRVVAFSGMVFDAPGHVSFVALLFVTGVITNLGLALFNLIPFGPLDGQWLLGLLLPEPARTHWFQLNRRIGFIGLFAVIILINFAHVSILDGPITYLFKLFIGAPGR